MNYKVINPEEIKHIYNEDEYLVRDKEDGKIYKLLIFREYSPENPREWDHLCTIVSPCTRDWDIADEEHHMERDEFGEWLKATKNNPDICWKLIYMYDHSGQTISISDFGDPWDSGICGAIYVTKERIFAECGGITEENWKERANEYIDVEVKEFDSYIRGDVFGFKLLECYEMEHKNLKTGEISRSLEWEEKDSCCGFYGDNPNKNGLFEEMGVPKFYEIIEEEK